MKVSQAKITPVIDVSVRQLCRKPYPNHRNGCPNYGCRPACPPEAKLWVDVCDLGTATWLFWTRFDLAAHRERMLAKHPKWSIRRLICCLYWQGTARKPLLDYLKTDLKRRPGFFATICPEAMGINVTETMKQVDVILEWQPERKWTYQVAMGGWLL